MPLIAAHLFVFYFGIMADVTPPVGLASFAAAAVSGGDPIRTGFTAFFYSLRTVALPFLFIFNTDLLLIDVGWVGGVFIFIVATIAMLLFAAGTQGYFIARSKIWESAALILIAFTLFRPGFWLDQVQPPFEQRSGTEIVEIAGGQPPDTELRVQIAGPSFDDADVTLTKTLLIPLGAEGDGAGRLESSGILTQTEGDQALMEEPFPGTPFGDLGETFDFYGDTPVTITSVDVPADRLPKEVFFLPALLLLGLVIMVQRGREEKPAAAPAEA